MTDLILEEMATELRNALVAQGLDPTNPPNNSAPPTERAFREYLGRGGQLYDDSEQFIQALIQEVKRDDLH